MNEKHHLIFAYCGLFFVAFFGSGWLIAGYVPPPSPAASAMEIAGFYQDNTIRVMGGLLIMMFAVALLLPFMAAISIQMARIEGRWPILAVSNALAGLANTLLILLFVICWIVAAFRPERDAEIIRMLNDFGWMIVVWPLSLAALQNVLIGTCVLSDTRSQPILPRWFGFFSIWVAILLLPGALVPFFKSGPFAWNGILAFWLAVSAYLVWLIVQSVVLIKPIKLQARALVPD